MNKKTNVNHIHSFETVYDKAVRKMEERDALIMNQPIECMIMTGKISLVIRENFI